MPAAVLTLCGGQMGLGAVGREMLLCYSRSFVLQKTTHVNKPKQKVLQWKRLGHFFSCRVPKFDMV